MKKVLKMTVVIILILSLVLSRTGGMPVSSNAASTGASDGLVCMYQFNNSTGTSEIVKRINDTAEGGNSGTLPLADSQADAKYADGISGKGIYLDGTYGLKLYPGLTGPSYTISMWVKPDAEQHYSNILYAGKGMLTDKEEYFTITSDDTASPVVISSSAEGGYYIGDGKALDAGKWSHICMAVEGGSASIYVNGRLQATGRVPDSICNKDTQYFVGLDCYNIPFKGCMDNIAFYNKCIGEDLARNIYNSEKNTAAAGSITGISLDKKTVSLNGYGSVAALFADIEPYNAANQAVNWSSSDESAATVNNGVVTGLKNGKTVITATTEDGRYKAECVVTVEGIQELKGISLDKTSVTLEGDGSSVQLAAFPVPLQAHLPEIIWSTSDSNVAIVEQDGNVFPAANGEADIIAKTKDGGFTAACHVTVKSVSKEVAVQSVEFTENSIKLDNINNRHQLGTVIRPANAANQACIYYSEDNSVAVIDDNGMVKAVGNGITDVCVMSSNGRYTGSCTVNVSGFVNTAVKTLELDKESMEVARGETGYLYVNVTPVTATEVLDWSSNNPDAVDVVADEYGMSAEVIVYEDAVMGSTAIITVSSETGECDECFVEVTEYGVKKINMEHKSLYMHPGESYEMETEIVPEEADNSEIIWKSSNRNVAVVNADGVIKVPKKAKSGAKAIITSSNIAQTKKSECKIIVRLKKVKIKKLVTKKKNISLYPGQKASMPVRYFPENATDVKIKYKSKNPDIVKVDKGGKISVPAGYKGTAEVKVVASSKNGKKVTSVVKVKQRKVKIKKLSVSKSLLDLHSGSNTTLYVKYSPANATQSNIKWSSSNSSVVKVSGNGRSASLSAGNISSKKTVTIKAKDVNGATASCKVSVYPKPATDNPGSGTKPGNNNYDTKPDNAKPGSNKPYDSNASKKIRKLSFGSGYIMVKRGGGKNLKNLLTISPSGADNDLVWKCGSKYASVSQDGYVSVSGKAQKNTNISVLVYSKGNSSAKASIIVSVTA